MTESKSRSDWNVSKNATCFKNIFPDGRACNKNSCKIKDDFIALGTRRGYEYPVAWAGYQIMKREERKERKIQEIELRKTDLVGSDP